MSQLATEFRCQDFEINLRDYYKYIKPANFINLVFDALLKKDVFFV